MYGSGAAIGMAIILRLPKPIQKDLQRVRFACSAAVAGTTLRGIAGRRTATATTPTSASTTLASASFPPSKQWLILSIILSKERFAFRSLVPHYFLANRVKIIPLLAVAIFYKKMVFQNDYFMAVKQRYGAI